MDASMAAYICALPLLVFIINWFIPKLKVPSKAIRVYSYFLISVCAILMAVNLNIYQEWGAKLPYRAISMFFEYPYEAYISSVSSPLLVPFLFIVIVVTVGWLMLRRIKFAPLTGTVNWYTKAIVSVILICGLFLLIRSGLQTTPLNPSMAYFSTKPILNHAAVNTEWNLLSDFLHTKGSNKNPYNYMEDSIAQNIISPYINSPSQPISVLNHDRPNVVLIILESFTSDLVESLGGEPGIAPRFEELISEGLLFTDIYAASDRTDKGMVAIMSGFPSQATKSIIKNVNKLEKLPAMGQEFFSHGYTTSYFTGGESEFYNVKSYMLSHNIQQVVDQHAFETKDVSSKWGAFDHLTFRKHLDSLNHMAEPFFSTLLTLTNHEPFDLPGMPRFGSASVADLFKSTAFYTDSALYDYLTRAKETDWYDNTLFVIVADHGHRLPLEKWDSHHPNRYRIPLLFYGNVLKEEFQGQKINQIGNQTDLVTTLLKQLTMDSKNYFWSKDLLDPSTPPFAFFSYDDGFGVVTPEQDLSFDNIGKQIIYTRDEAVQDSINQKIKVIGQAYLQEVYRQYLAY